MAGLELTMDTKVGLEPREISVSARIKHVCYLVILFLFYILIDVKLSTQMTFYSIIFLIV